VSNGGHGDVPPYAAAGGTPNQSQYPKFVPGPGQPGWSSPESRGSNNGSPPPPNTMQQQQMGYYGAQPGGMAEQGQGQGQSSPRSPIFGIGRKASEARGPHEMYAPVPEDGHEN